MKRNKIKAGLALLMSALMLFGMTACGPKEPAPGSETQSQTDSTVSGDQTGNLPSDTTMEPGSSDPSSEGGTSTAASANQTSSKGGGTTSSQAGHGGGITNNSTIQTPDYDLKGKTVTIWTPEGAPKKNTVQYASWKYVEKKYGCTLKFSKVSEQVIVNKMTAASISGKAECDIWLTPWYNVFPSYIAKGMVTPLSDYYAFGSDPNWKNDENMKLNTWNGKLYGLSYGAETPAWGMWYNKALLRAAGAPDPADLYKQGKWTWDEFLKICEKVTKDTNNDGKNDIWGYYDEYLFATCILTNGGEIVTIDGSGKAKFNLNSPKAKKGLEFTLDLLNKYKYVPHIGSVGDPVLLDMFKKGQVAFTTYSLPYGADAIAKGIKAADLGYIYPPKGPDATDYVVHAPTYSPVYVVSPQLEEGRKKQVVKLLQDWICIWDTNKEFAVKKSDIITTNVNKSPYKEIFANNKDFILNGGKKNKVAYLNSFALFDIINVNLLYPLKDGKITLDAGIEKVTPLAQAQIDSIMSKLK